MQGHLYLKVLLSCWLLDFFLSQKAPEAPREPAVISVSVSPVRVNHPIQNGSQGFHGNLLSRLHKRVLRVHRDLARSTTNSILGRRREENALCTISQQQQLAECIRFNEDPAVVMQGANMEK